MRKLPLTALLALLWQVLAAVPLHAQPAYPCDTTWRQHANGRLDGAHYLVVPYDTLYSIAKRLCLPLADLQRANGILDPNLIMIGQWLNVPPSGTGSGSQCSPPALTITSPVGGTSVPGAVFEVSGSACGHAGATISVYAWDQSGADVVTTQLYAVNAGTGSFTARMELRNVRGPVVTLQAQGPGDVRSNPVTVNYNVTPGGCTSPYVAISEARQLATSPAAIYVAGQAGPYCRVTVTVTAPTGSGATQAFTGYVDTGAGATWNITLLLPGGYVGGLATVDASTSAGRAAPVTVQLNGSPGAGYRDLYQLQGCHLVVLNNAAQSYTHPDGLFLSQLGVNWQLTPLRSVPVGGQPWYAIASLTPGKPNEWVRGTDVQLTGGCPQ